MGEDRRAPVSGARGLSREDLVSDLRTLGVRYGQTLLVHASLSRLGWVDGGAATVVAALRAVVGADGNVVVCAGTQENSVTSRAHLASIDGLPPEQVAQLRNRMPAFDPKSAPAGAGQIARHLCTLEETERSRHPQSSFAAVGPRAAELMHPHPLNCHHGARSPLGRLYALAAEGQLDVAILMLGVGYRACTALHLAEYRYPNGRSPRRYPPARTYMAKITVKGRPRWTLYRDAVLDDSDFEAIGDHLDKEIVKHQGYVGEASSRLMPFLTVVDHATEWMRQHRA
jgi:aminoglycoside 3-N-acetyltransferase